MAAKQIITNGDRIRNMSDDELAEFFEEVEVDLSDANIAGKGENYG